jgi:membrane-bound metal-dependent hydrolase YbcI (DUF457 family)
MFIGHFAVGFAAKRAAPQVSLAMLFLAAQLADVLWPFLLAAGVESVRIDPGNTAFTPLDFVSYPYSHSLLLLAVWAFALGYAYKGVRRASPRTAVLIAALVLSHWILDVVTHRPDMPLYPGSVTVGLGLWHSVPATLVVEGAMFAIGVAVYARTTRARDAIGRWAFAGLVAFLLAAYAGNIAGGAPPSVTAIWIASIVGSAVILALSAWVERHRDSRRAALSGPPRSRVGRPFQGRQGLA